MIDGKAALPAPATVLCALGGAMLCMALYAGLEGEGEAAEAFALGGAGALGGAAALAAGFRGFTLLTPLRAEALLLAAGWTAVPAFAAFPLTRLLPEIGLLGAWFEMVSGFTTTGATVVADLESRPRSLIVWRSVSQWMGGFATLAAILAILAPRRLGSFGGESALSLANWRVSFGGDSNLPDLQSRLLRSGTLIAPAYAAATMLLAAGYALGGMSAFDAVNHAMTTISTGGFSTRDAGLASWNRWPIEAVAVAGMLLGAVSVGVHDRILRGRWHRLSRDNEIRLLGLILLAATLAPFLLGALEAAGEGVPFAMAETLRSLWADFFLAVSFLTTTGFASSLGAAGRGEAELPAVLLLGLAAVGGGVASTAGGIRLRCVALLLLHSLGEVGRIGLPRVVLRGRPSAQARAEVRAAWLAAMLFAATASTGMLACTLAGLPFDLGMGAAIASLSNAGPLLPAISGDPRVWAKMPSEAQAACCLLMALGRFGLLALLAAVRPR